MSHTLVVVTAQIIKVLKDMLVPITCVLVYFPFTEACVKNSLFTMADIGTAVLHTLPLHTHFLLQGFISKLPIVY